MAFMDKLECHGCGSDGRVTKLDAIDAFSGSSSSKTIQAMPCMQKL